jgi:hypothetical protein
MSLETQEDKIRTYKEAWTRLNPAAEKEVWTSDFAVNFPWSTGKVDLWRTLRSDIETKFKTVLDRHLNGEFTTRPIQPFSFMDYSEMLFELLDIYLTGLDKYIATQDDIDKVSRDMDAYPEDMRDLLEKGMRTSGLKRARDFFDVIAFMHAVPQRVYDRWDTLDQNWDVSWFREYCKVYQDNEELMSFLSDCVVVVLIISHFNVQTDVKAIHECYRQLGAKALLDEAM